MDAVNIESEIKEYKKWVGLIDNEDGSPDSEVLWALIARDVLFESASKLNPSQEKQIYALDEQLKQKRALVSIVLPAKASTPQARAEGRWWWFLNEN